MFNISDTIVYPNQGIGTIVSIQEEPFLGELQTYYKIKFRNGSLEIMLPKKRLENSNIRLLSNSEDLDDAFDHIDDFAEDLCEMNECNLKERMLQNSLKLKSSTIKDYIEVILNLTEVQNHHHLNSSEKQMLTNTTSSLIDEISLAKDITTENAADLLDDLLSKVKQ